MRRYYILQDDPTTAGNGSKVIGAYRNDTYMGRALAVEGNDVYCGACKSVGRIVCIGPRLSDKYDGLEAALSDDICVCKCEPSPLLINTMNAMYQDVTVSEAVGSVSARIVASPASNLTSATSIYDEQVRAAATGVTLRGYPYLIETADGQTLAGRVDAVGKLPRIETGISGNYTVHWGDDALAKQDGAWIMPNKPTIVRTNSTPGSIKEVQLKALTFDEL